MKRVGENNYSGKKIIVSLIMIIPHEFFSLQGSGLLLLKVSLGEALSKELSKVQRTPLESYYLWRDETVKA